MNHLQSRIEAYRAYIRKCKLTLFLYLVLFAVFSLVAYRIYLGVLKLRREFCDVIVYGGGPVAWLTASSLLEKGHDVLLYTPSHYTMTTLFLRGTSEAISVPSCLAFYTEPFRLLASTPAERKRLAHHLSLPLTKIEEAEKKLFNRCQKIESTLNCSHGLSSKLTEIIDKLGKTDGTNTDPNVCMANGKVHLDSYNFNWQSFFFPRARTYYTSLRDNKVEGEDVRCRFANGTSILCSTLVIVEEFPLSTDTRKMTLSGPIGFSTHYPTDNNPSDDNPTDDNLTNNCKSPFAEAIVLPNSGHEDIFVDVSSDGHEVTLSVSSIAPYTSLPSLTFQPLTDNYEELHRIINLLTNTNNNFQLKPISRSQYGPLPGLYQHTYPKQPRKQPGKRPDNSSPVVHLNCLSVPGSNDTLRDLLILAMRSEILLAI